MLYTVDVNSNLINEFKKEVKEKYKMKIIYIKRKYKCLV